jgi:uncharacterized protein HemX
MKKETKDKKSTQTSWIGKTATMAAVVAALGISLGVNVQKVYGGEDIKNSGVVQDKHMSWGAEQGKIESQQEKIKSQQSKIKSQHLKIDATQHKNEMNLETK